MEDKMRGRSGTGTRTGGFPAGVQGWGRKKKAYAEPHRHPIASAHPSTRIGQSTTGRTRQQSIHHHHHH
jgi:hypothetical protein